MKVYNLVQTYGKDCYVVTAVRSRNEEGTVQDVQIESFANEFSQAVERRRVLKEQEVDALIVPPFLTEDVSPAETADFLRAFYGWNEEKDLSKDESPFTPRLFFFYG